MTKPPETLLAETMPDAEALPDFDQYIVVALAEPAVLREPFTAWPLHITLVPGWFKYERGPQDLVQKLRKIVADQPPFTVTAGPKTYFGRHKEIPVHLVNPTDSLQTIHEKLMNFVTTHAKPVKKFTYTGMHYTPHITVRGQRSIKPGTTVPINSLYLAGAKANNPERTLLAELPLQGGTHA